MEAKMEEVEESVAMRRLIRDLREKESRARQMGEFCSYNICDNCGELVLYEYQRDDDLPDVVLLGVIERGRVCVNDFGRCRDCIVVHGRRGDQQMPLPDLTPSAPETEIFVEPPEEPEEPKVRRVVTPQELEQVRHLVAEGGLREG